MDVRLLLHSEIEGWLKELSDPLLAGDASVTTKKEEFAKAQATMDATIAQMRDWGQYVQTTMAAARKQAVEAADKAAKEAQAKSKEAAEAAKQQPSPTPPAQPAATAAASSSSRPRVQPKRKAKPAVTHSDPELLAILNKRAADRTDAEVLRAAEAKIAKKEPDAEMVSVPDGEGDDV